MEVLLHDVAVGVKLPKCSVPADAPKLMPDIVIPVAPRFAGLPEMLFAWEMP
jgi:hypothetical protein